MSHITLINPPQNTVYPQPPMGLALLGAVLERENYPVEIVDGNITKLDYKEITRLLYDTEVFGITAMTPTINSALTIIKQLKWEKIGAKVILGGVHATLLPEETLESATGLDCLVVGEGDNAILEVLQKVLKNNTKVIYKSMSKVDMDSLPFLAYHLLPWRSYRPHPPHGRALPFFAMITSRGCPYHCSYCSKAVYGDKFRAQSPERVVEELYYYIKRFGVKEVAFYDDVFTLDRKRAYGIAEKILKWGMKLCWTCETRTNLVDVELLKIMKKAGCYSIAYGIESGSQEVLDSIDKAIDLEQAEETVRKTREAGIQTIGYFMIGSPSETHETARKTIEFAKRLKLDYAQFSITIPYPGTRLYNVYMDGNGKNCPWENFVYAKAGSKTSPIFESDDLSRDDIEYWVSKAYREFYLRSSYVWQRLGSVRSVGDVKVLAKGLKMLRGM